MVRNFQAKENVMTTKKPNKPAAVDAPIARLLTILCRERRATEQRCSGLRVAYAKALEDACKH